MFSKSNFKKSCSAIANTSKSILKNGLGSMEKRRGSVFQVSDKSHFGSKKKVQFDVYKSVRAYNPKSESNNNLAFEDSKLPSKKTKKKTQQFRIGF